LALIKKSVDASLLFVKVLTLDGDLYRIVFGQKRLVTYETSERPQIDDSTVLMTEERFPGDDIVHYSVAEIEVSSDTSLSEEESDFAFTEIGNYSITGFTFDYQVIPTLDRGPLVIKTFVSPVSMLTLKGYLSSYLKKSEAADRLGNKTMPPDIISKDQFLKSLSSIKMTVTNQLNKTLSI